MSEIEDDIHATAESLAAESDRLEAIEKEKADLAAHDPRRLVLAAEAEEITLKMAAKAKIERALTMEAASEE
jgi:hypothetical protein